MASEIPAATLAAGDQSDPAWWLACAAWHEEFAAIAQRLGRGHEAANYRDDYDREAAYHSAAALACRTFAAMMERSPRSAYWVYHGGEFSWAHEASDVERSLPAAAVAALTEDTQ